MWTGFLGGMVRSIAFSQDNSMIFFSSGDNNLYAFNRSTGAQIWKTYINGWAHSLMMSTNLIGASGKSGRAVKILNQSDGSVVWQYPVEVQTDGGAIAIAQDGVVVASPQADTMIFNGAGIPQWSILGGPATPPPMSVLGASAATFSPDGTYVGLLAANAFAGPNNSWDNIQVYSRAGDLLWSEWIPGQGPWLTGEAGVFIITPGAERLLIGSPTSGTVSIFERVESNTHDFNGDGKSDIAWRDGSGDIAFWLMNGAAVSSTGSVGGIPSAWSIVGQRDFNGDGKADLLWLDTSGNIAMWFMNGAASGSTAVVGNIPTNWSVAGVADFNGDGLGDILWRDTAGDYAVWLMNGATVTSSVVLGNLSPTTWTAVGTGDFDGDGMTDILWRDTAGDTAIWFMNGTTVTSSALVGTIANWTVVGTGDFDGDGKSDIVWRDTAGDAAIWLMNGAAAASTGGLGNIGTTWSIVQTGDYNGDGMSDLLWRDTSGNTAMWFMNGTTVASTGVVGNIPTNWTVQSVNAE
jgi:hypothetical protein